MILNQTASAYKYLTCFKLSLKQPKPNLSNLDLLMQTHLLPPVYTNSQNRIRLHKIGRRDRKISIFPSDFVQSDLILAVHVNAGLIFIVVTELLFFTCYQKVFSNKHNLFWTSSLFFL